MITNADYITGSSMLSSAQMNAVTTQYEETPCQWLWEDYTPSGFNLLNRFVSLCYGMAEYMKESLFQPDMNAALRAYGRTDFNPPPSQAVLVGLGLAWESIAKVLEAERSFCALIETENRPLDAAERFLSMRAMLVLLRKALNEDRRTTEVWWWLGRIGWYEMLALADKRDHAARELIAGRAFSDPEGGIAVLPPDWSCRAAA